MSGKNLFTIIFTVISFSLYSQIPVFNTFDTFEKEVLSNKRDTAYLYNFWATWCKPCVEELPFLVSLSNQYSKEKTKVIFISLDSKKDAEKLESFAQKNLSGQTVIHLTDHKYNSWLDRVHSSWSGSIPASLFKKVGYSEFHEKQYESFDDLLIQWVTFLKN
jgi:thiol-disulfide isomerase/thioredoxin